ncbi:ABC transporter ATP-binding protein [Pediococcus cellicola]|uniref:ABC transporter, ATP-binding protein n=1 Tax=Pediococcus cellicola TaxID=319652 RepID=A0A0R2IH24_9LACO|nr:ABC transporter ATP-binding protein [Pediococcus cellicola]KRN64323.1 ABC transporter, ATP-binding protein [Pediococcus cellicola]GEL16115.1 ABC transporter ATP-binding protein [Pediococcus cellicola]
MLTVKNLTHWYGQADKPLYEDVDLSFDTGQVYTIVGASGSGKTTLLSFLAGLDKPQKGDIFLDGKNLKKIGATNYRKHKVAIVFQQYNLLGYMSALDNILTALSVTGSAHKGERQYVLDTLKRVGINEDDAKKNAQKLSGGQQQRVAIVRALLVDANIVIADEPTGNLDGENAAMIINLFQELAHDHQKSVIIVTHDPHVADQGDVKISLENREFVVA